MLEMGLAITPILATPIPVPILGRIRRLPPILGPILPRLRQKGAPRPLA